MHLAAAHFLKVPNASLTRCWVAWRDQYTGAALIPRVVCTHVPTLPSFSSASTIIAVVVLITSCNMYLRLLRLSSASVIIIAVNYLVWSLACIYVSPRFLRLLFLLLLLLTALNCNMSALPLVQYALLLTPACWQSINAKARLMAFALFLALDPTFGIHSHKTQATAQPRYLLKPDWKPSSSLSISENLPLLSVFLKTFLFSQYFWKPSSSLSISAPSNINTQFMLQ